MDYWRVIQRRLHSESALHYPRNKVRLILRAYVNGILNQYLEDAVHYAEQGYLLTCTGAYLDERGDELNIPRIKGETAKGTVTFSLPEPAYSKLKIPRNTMIYDKDTSYEYVTTKDAYIEKENDNVTVNVQAITYGKRYNTEAGQLTIFDKSRISSSLEATNEVPIVGGTDGETDEEYRKRLFAANTSKLTVNYLKKQGIILYSKKEFEDNIRINLTSLNPYLNNIYAGIPPNNQTLKFLDEDVIHNKHIKIYKKGWK